jgi:beta-phosphoglucomutase-like phosphatase (HAD superfamily)
MIKFIHIFDCDGVLLDSTHRYRTMPCGTRIDLDHWRENSTPEMIAQDKPLPMSNWYKKFLTDPEHYVIIATARVCQEADHKVIADKLGTPQYFIYRGENDSRSGTALKLAGLKPLLNLKQFRQAAITVYEDNVTYLNGIAEALDANKHYCPSPQGH